MGKLMSKLVGRTVNVVEPWRCRHCWRRTSFVPTGEFQQPKFAPSAGDFMFLDADRRFKWKERNISRSPTIHESRARFHFIVYRFRQLCVICVVYNRHALDAPGACS
jgi:hypothetical protein